jgi:hypothetical protein
MDKFEKLISKPHLEGPKQQHYVPRFYLEGFTSDDALSVFDRTKGEIRERQLPNNVAKVGHLYTFQDKEDRKRFDLEKLFDLIEGEAAPILKSLANGDRISSAQRETFALFLGLAAVRTPAAIEEAGSVYAGFVKMRSRLILADECRALKILRKMNGAGADEVLLREQARDVSKMARDESHDLDVKVNPQSALLRSLETWHIVAEQFVERDWMVLHAAGNDQSFLTSDSPIVLLSTSTATRALPIGYGSPHAQILFPLTSTCALVAEGSLGRIGRSDIEADALRRYNMTVAQDCHRFVMGGDSDLVESITTELGLARTKWQPKSSVEVWSQKEADGSVSTGAYVKRKGA